MPALTCSSSGRRRWPDDRPSLPGRHRHAAQVATTELDRRWLALQAKCPQLTATSRRYLEQISVSLSASSVRVAVQTLRGFCTFLADEHPHVSTFAQVGRPEIEDYKKHLVSRPGQKRLSGRFRGSSVTA